MTDKQFRFRSNIVISFFVVLALLFAGRLYSLQIAKADWYDNRADRQYATPSSALFSRGSIFMQGKDGTLVSAASTKSGYRLAIIPKQISEPEDLYAKLSTIVDLDRDDFIKKASKDDTYEEVAHRLTKDQADAIVALDHDGVRVFQERWRTYPSGQTGSQIIGFTAFKGDEYTGRYGLELQYNEILSRASNDYNVNFFAEIFAELNKLLTLETTEGDIITTIEPSVQVTLEQEVQKIADKWGSASAHGIVIDPQTGAIKAMANYPSFDLNNFGKVDDINVYRNPLVQNVHEMGSTIKPLIVTVGLDTNSITAETSYDDKGYVTVGPHTIWNYDKEGRGPNTTVQGILDESLNTGMVYIAQKIGKDNIKKYLEAFGLSEQTGIDLPAEGKNITSNLKSSGEVEYANISFGQGLALTPISTARALSAMANGGYLVQPHVVEEIRHTNGLKTKLEYERKGPILKPGTSGEISRILVNVVDEALGDGKQKLENYSIAAKTGTAQIPNPENGGYYSDRNLHSFFGYFPAYNPQFLVFFYTVHPKGAKYSSQTLTDPFMNMAKFLINYYNIEPDR